MGLDLRYVARSASEYIGRNIIAAIASSWIGNACWCLSFSSGVRKYLRTSFSKSITIWAISEEVVGTRKHANPKADHADSSWNKVAGFREVGTRLSPTHPLKAPRPLPQHPILRIPIMSYRSHICCSKVRTLAVFANLTKRSACHPHQEHGQPRNRCRHTSEWMW